MSLIDNTHSLQLPCFPTEELPAEILIEIAAVATDALALLTLSSVCRYWRDVLVSSPRVWQLIQLNDGCPLASSRAQAELWLARSAPLQFDVSIHADNHDLVLPLLAPFLPHLQRWRGFSMTGLREEFISFHDLLAREETSMNDLSLTVCSEPDADFDDVYDPRRTFEQYSPLWSDRIVMNVWLSELPSSSSLMPLHFTTINITEQSLSHHLSPDAILDFLAACPMLEEFGITGLLHEDAALPQRDALARLPKLRILKIRSTCSTRALLSLIDCPILEELYLSHLNVDFRLGGGQGDNEDNTEDNAIDETSTSPWSDRATGLGLRKLLSQCSPPLRRLEMDLSDMRSKDFRYVFERLPHLRDLLIVASDMSNTIMELFRPFSSVDGVRQVRMPELKNLELYDCLRLSGDVVVDVLMDRVRHTDLVTPEFTLSEVALVGCDAFTQSHEQTLERVLGDRIRMDD